MNKSKALDPTSAAFLFTEKRTTPMHIAVLGIYKIPKGSDEAKFLQRLVDTVGDIERFRFPFGSRLHSSLTGPSWIADDDIDISYHLRRSGLATPGDFEQLFTLVSRLHGTSLDRERPLAKLDPEPFNGNLQERNDIFLNPFGLGIASLQIGNDRTDATRPVHFGQHRRSALVELDHAFRVEQHMAVLRGLPLEAETTAQRWNLGQLNIAHHHCLASGQVAAWPRGHGRQAVHSTGAGCLMGGQDLPTERVPTG